jgi:hypothetical protein
MFPEKPYPSTIENNGLIGTLFSRSEKAENNNKPNNNIIHTEEMTITEHEEALIRVCRSIAGTGCVNLPRKKLTINIAAPRLETPNSIIDVGEYASMKRAVIKVPWLKPITPKITNKNKPT